MKTQNHLLYWFFASLLINIPAFSNGQSIRHLSDQVNPLSGTGASTTRSAIKHNEGTERYANTIPPVGSPFGMIQWTPQTQLSKTKCLPPYRYKDLNFFGFRGSHWLSGSCVADYGSFTIFPMTGKLETRITGTNLDHRNELSTPYTYKILLPEKQLIAEVTGTPRCGSMRFTMLRDDSLYLLISPNSDQSRGYIQTDRSGQCIKGYNPVHRIYQNSDEPAGFNGYFVVKFNKPYQVSATYDRNGTQDQDTLKDRPDGGAYVGFKMKKGETLEVMIGTSFTSFENAVHNLQSETGQKTFDMLKQGLQKTWDRSLSQIRISSSSIKEKAIFYTALYHAMQSPRLYNDVNGDHPQFDSQYQTEHQVKGDYYDDFSMWDTYRAQLPLLEILQPELVNAFVRSLLIKGDRGGWLPIFPCWNNYTAAMVGDHTSAFIASAFLKNIRGFDADNAYRLMRRNALEISGHTDYLKGKGRRAQASYLKFGYIPLEDKVKDAFHQNEQVSRTLEYAYDDHAVAVMAKLTGHKDDLPVLTQHSKNYRQVYDHTTGLVRGRYADGSFIADFKPDNKESYITEGTPRQYSFFVPHDIPGLAKLLGGYAKLEQKLDTFFIHNEYWHGNEPGHHTPFLYNYTASSWKTQMYVRSILKEEYSDGPGGLGGNDDSGQMSAWYVFASLGFYPVDPVSNRYFLCSPTFDHATIKLARGVAFKIAVHRRTTRSAFIYRMKWNNRIYERNFITHDMLTSGGKLDFFLSDKPSKLWSGQVFTKIKQ